MLVARTLRLIALPVVVVAATALFETRIREEMIDFVTWRQAVVHAIHGEPLYPTDAGHYQFKYLPAFALLMAPFGLLNRDAAKLVWFATEIGLLAALLRWSISALPARRLSQGVLLAFAVLLMAKFYAHELLLGQTNLLLAVLLLGALIAIQAKRPVLAGAVAGAAVFVKPYALVLLPWLIVTQGWRAGVATLAVVSAGLLLPAAVYGWNGNVDLLNGWLRTVTDSTAPLLLNNDNISVAAMWAKWLGPGPLAASLAWLTIAATVALVIAVLSRRRSVTAPEYLECALLMLLVPLISPQGWDYVLLLATPAVVCIVDRWPGLPVAWRWGLAVALATMGLSMFDIMGRAAYGRFMAMSIISVCALSIAAGLAYVRRRGLA